METIYDFNDMTQHLTGPLLDFYMLYLEIEDRAQLRFGYDIFADASTGAAEFEDITELPHPDKLTSELILNDVYTPDVAIGRVEFGRYAGSKVIIEQNASPLLVYWKGG